MTADTDVLPVLLLHGAWLWKLVLGLLVAAVALAIRARRRTHARRRAGDAADELDRGAGVIRGKLRGGEGELVATLVVTRADHPEQRTTPVIASWRAAELWLETDQGRVAIEGPLVVVAGTIVSARRHGVPLGIREELFERAREQASWVHRARPLTGDVETATVMTLRDGDEVVATGQLEQAPSQDEPGSYRAGAVAWTLRPADGKPSRIAARIPGFAVVRLAIPAMLVIAGVTLGTGYFVAKQLGAHWRRSCTGDWRDLGAVDLTNTHACVLAATMPGSRDRALEAVLARLDNVRVRDDRTRRETLAVAQLAGGCSAVAARLHVEQRYDETADVALACGDLRQAHRALVQAGRFAEACAVHVPADGPGRALPEASTLIACGRWAEAAAAVEARVAEEATRETDDPQRDRTAMDARCLAQLLRHHAGDPRALPWLRTHHDARVGSACTLALAELVPEERATLLALRYGSTNTSLVAKALASASGVPRKDDYELHSPEEILVKPAELDAVLGMGRVWLAAGVAPLLGEHPELRTAALLRWLAVHQVFAGEFEAAKRSAAEARSLVDPTATFDHRNLQHLTAAISLHTEATDAPVDLARLAGSTGDNSSLRAVWQHDFGRLLLRAGQPIDTAYFGPDDELKIALGQAAQGNGEPLATYLATARNPWWGDGDVLAVFPRIRTGREAVREVVAGTLPREVGRLDWHYPFSLVGRVIERRAVLRMVGATADAARWDTIYQRLDATFSDRKRLVALMLWDR